MNASAFDVSSEVAQINFEGLRIYSKNKQQN
jgi:hypothetical protein